MSGRRVSIASAERRAPERAGARGGNGGAATLPGVNVVGYLHNETGVGEAARTLVRALRHAGHPVACTTVSSPDGARQSDRSVGAIEGAPVHGISIFCVNASETDTVYRELGPAFFAARHNIGLWFWELDAFPASEPALEFFDEIWTSSRFVQRAVAEVSPAPVLNIRLPVTPPAPMDGVRARLGLPLDRHLVLFAFDALSVVERKNPLAVVRAFSRAFGRSSKHAHLVIKASRLELFPDEQRALRDAIKAVDGTLIDAYLDRATLGGLFHACDAYVSLHRSEGFGLTIAEAMAIGKPVVATAYSGNMDFMTVGNSAMVRYALTRLERAFGPYPVGACWAEPEIDHAAELMERVARDQAFATTIGQRAAADMAATHGVEPVARLLSARITTIHRQSRGDERS